MLSGNHFSGGMDYGGYGGDANLIDGGNANSNNGRYDGGGGGFNSAFLGGSGNGFSSQDARYGADPSQMQGHYDAYGQQQQQQQHQMYHPQQQQQGGYVQYGSAYGGPDDGYGHLEQQQSHQQQFGLGDSHLHLQQQQQHLAPHLADSSAGNSSGFVNPAAVPKHVPQHHTYLYQDRELQIRDVWRDNLEEEMREIRRVAERYRFVAMDTEFPGVVARPVGASANAADLAYQTLRCNVDLLKLIQLGIALCDEEGRFADGCPCWQFHFKFSLSDDMYAQDSIDLLLKSGIDFDAHERHGIDVADFGELLVGSGLVLRPEVTWISFHGAYDFGYLLKLLTCAPLPPAEKDFLALLRTWFPRLLDVKAIMCAVEGADRKRGLEKLAMELSQERVGPAHQAGSDSLLTANVFFAVLKKFLKSNKRVVEDQHTGVLHGIGEAGRAY